MLQAIRNKLILILFEVPTTGYDKIGMIRFKTFVQQRASQGLADGLPFNKTASG